MMNVTTTQNQTSILEELNLIVYDNSLLENKSVEDIMKIVLKAIEEINESYNEAIIGGLKKLQFISNDVSESQDNKWKNITKSIAACFSLPNCFSLPKGVNLDFVDL